MLKKYISLVGLGAVGTPLTDLLFKEYGDDFALLSSREFLGQLEGININGRQIEPKIFCSKEELDKPIGVIFICVKNYHLTGVYDLLKNMIDCDTVIVPLQNGLYSYDFFVKNFPENCVIEGFAKGPNTKILPNNHFVYEKTGVFHIGTSYAEKRDKTLGVYELMKKANVPCYYDENIKKEIWKKLMLNVAGNAITALTGLDYSWFADFPEAQELCVDVMKEYAIVAKTQNVIIDEFDIESVIKYYLSFNVSKKTSMLEDVLNCRQTENDFIAGYIVDLAKKEKIATPKTDVLYELMKIKERVYLKYSNKTSEQNS